MQSGETAVQILSSAAAPQGPAAHQRTESSGPQKRAHAPDGHGASTPVGPARPDTHHSKPIMNSSAFIIWGLGFLFIFSLCSHLFAASLFLLKAFGQ